MQKSGHLYVVHTMKQAVLSQFFLTLFSFYVEKLKNRIEQGCASRAWAWAKMWFLQLFQVHTYILAYETGTNVPRYPAGCPGRWRWIFSWFIWEEEESCVIKLSSPRLGSRENHHQHLKHKARHFSFLTCLPQRAWLCKIRPAENMLFPLDC